MTGPDRIEALLERFIEGSIADRQASNERMKATDERLVQLAEKQMRDSIIWQMKLRQPANNI